MSAETGATGSLPRSGRGRPRDPKVDRRILEAALEVYADLGWAGFNFEAVARRAGVGRPALYRRWLSSEALLIDAIDRSGSVPEVEDVGTARDQLVDLACQLFTEYIGIRGLAGLRLIVEVRSHPEVFAAVAARRNEARVMAAREIVRRGVARGQLDADVSPTLILDAICGAMLNHALATPEYLRQVVSARSERYATELVDLVLEGRPGVVAPKRPAG